MSRSRGIRLQDCEFTAPAGWSVQQQADHVRLQNTESGCVILVIEPQPSSGNAEQDARAAFALMYQGWVYQKAGEQAYTLSRGQTLQGLEFSGMEAAMSTTTADGRYHLEEGAAIVVKAEGSMVIIAARHNSSMFAHDRCGRPDGWPRFFASFTVRSVTPPAHADEDPATRIVGRWTMTEGRASAEYVFAANGRYQRIGALGSWHTTSEGDHEVIYTTTSAFEGDGSYAVKGNRLTLSSRAGAPEEISLRFVQVDHAGTGWKDRLYLLRNDGNGGYEVAYERD
jgi:hypothetical protein